MHIGSKVFSQEDIAHNKLFMRAYYDENKNYTFASIHLKLAKEKRNRLLGYVDVDNATFHCVRDTSKHLHYKSMSFGFNWAFLNGQFVYIDKISLRVDDHSLYVFPKSLLKEYGVFLNFKQQGFELQRFLKYDLIKRYEKQYTDVNPSDFIEFTEV